MKIDIDKIENNAFAIRSSIVDVTDLAESMEAKGLINPITVRPENGKYRLIAGHRRLMAAKQLGWKQIEASVVEVDDVTAMAIAIMENRDRQDVDPFDEARGVVKYSELYRKARQEEGKKATVKEIHDSLNMSERQYYRMFKFLDLEPVVKKVEVERDKETGTRAGISQRDLEDYTPFRTVYKDKPDKLEEVYRETIELKPSERKRVLDKMRVQPDRSVKEVIKEVQTTPGPIQLKLSFYSELAVGIAKAASDRKATHEDIVQVAVKDWLRRNKYV